MTQWQWFVRRILRLIWFRAALISLLSIALALVSAWLAPLMPYDLSLKVGAQAADNILTILASSMLAVTTFSMAAMVSAFNGAAANVSPRAVQLLIEDKTAQNALSTFLGGFLFGTVGIVALSTGFYGAEGRAILLFGTIAMILVIVATLLGWIQQLTAFGRMSDAIDRVEEAAIMAIGRYPGPILLTGKPRRDIPANGHPVCADRTGHINFYNCAEIDELSEAQEAHFHALSGPGDFVDARSELGWTDRPLSSDARAKIADAFSISPHRDFAHDPRFGAVVLAEIASRALSPAVNDPGSAIGVLGAGQRVLEALLEHHEETSGDKAKGAPLSFEEMVEDLIMPIVRDGAALFEVGIRLQSTLGSLAERSPASRAKFEAIAKDALDRARATKMAGPDLERIEAGHRRSFTKD
ncbi:MAG: DUF2254 domain-containing protein [Pseudomonadota bacterium]|nr:DUF2254 domain-containing protein [Pseudomonadota bacterium]